MPWLEAYAQAREKKITLLLKEMSNGRCRSTGFIGDLERTGKKGIHERACSKGSTGTQGNTNLQNLKKYAFLNAESAIADAKIIKYRILDDTLRNIVSTFL